MPSDLTHRHRRSDVYAPRHRSEKRIGTTRLTDCCVIAGGNAGNGWARCTIASTSSSSAADARAPRDAARQHAAVAVHAEAQRRHALLVARLRAGSDSACSAAIAPARDRASSRWRRGSRRCRGSAPAASPPCAARSAAPPWCAAPACSPGPACVSVFWVSGLLLGLLLDRLRLGLRQRHLRGRRRLHLRHRLDDLGLDLLRRLRRRLRLDHVRTRREIVRRGRRDRQRRKIDDHRRRNGRALRLRRGHQQIARHQPEMRRADDRRGQAPALEFLARVRVRQDERLRRHFASRSSNPTSATLRKPAERSAFITSMTSP